MVILLPRAIWRWILCRALLKKKDFSVFCPLLVEQRAKGILKSKTTVTGYGC
jgi:hypothetical protein